MAIHLAIRNNEPLYSVRLSLRGNPEVVRYEVLNHSWPCDRVPTGACGNPGMSRPGTFQGKARGATVCVAGYRWVVEDAIDLARICQDPTQENEPWQTK